MLAQKAYLGISQRNKINHQTKLTVCVRRTQIRPVWCLALFANLSSNSKEMFNLSFIGVPINDWIGSVECDYLRILKASVLQPVSTWSKEEGIRLVWQRSRVQYSLKRRASDWYGEVQGSLLTEGNYFGDSILCQHSQICVITKKKSDELLSDLKFAGKWWIVNDVSCGEKWIGK